MIITFQVHKIINNIIERIKHPITVKGTATKQFKDYQQLFNSMSLNDRKFIVKQIIYSRGRLIRHGLETKVDVHLEGLGTFEFKENRAIFFDKIHDKIESEGYASIKDLPRDVKTKLVKEVNGELDAVRKDKYFKRLALNKAKKQSPYPISIKLNIDRQI